MPCGFSKSGLPIGVQLIGKPFAEADLLALAHTYDREHDWAKRRPAI
jgi:aspartyl-tRNA(Asn)/glutamyl-tRNA(Gln) amidotransferase subunit A